MTNEFDHLHYSPIWNYPYEHWFREVKYNGRELNKDERREFLQVVDETISTYSSGLPLINETLEQKKDLHDEFHKAYSAIISVLQFTTITMIDSMVIGKHFILSDNDYERRFMRGKMKVILNEGFKKLYGFEKKTHNTSEWNKIAPILKYFPEDIKNQYEELSSLLEEHAKSSSWWREERNVETHLDMGKLYASRCEEVVESKVMMDSLKLYNTLYAVNLFLTNAHAYLLTKFKQGELKEK